MSTPQTGVTGVAHLALHADDPAAQAAFYSEAVGLELRGHSTNGPAYTGVPGVPGWTLVFFPRGSRHPERREGPAISGLHHIALRVDRIADLRAARHRLADRGIADLGARSYGGNAVGLRFRDPEANLVELLWRAPPGRRGQRFVIPIDLDMDDDAILAAMTQPPDARRIVADGYDRIADRYAQWVARETVDGVRPRYATLLVERLPAGARLLELGCGGGGPTTRQLASRFDLTGVDISPRQIELAGQNAPGAAFVLADMTALDLPDASFDGVAGFYCLSHLPYGELPGMLARVGRWLRPGGLFVGSVSPREDWGTIEDDWLGAPMYFSGYTAEENLRFVAEAGLILESSRIEQVDEDGETVAFQWIVARRPDG